MAVKNIDKLFFYNDRKLVKEFEELALKAKVKILFPKLIKNNASGYCTFVDNMLSVDASGNVSPCCGVPPNKKFGNIFTDKNVLNNKTFVFLRKLMARKPLYSCLKCHFFFANKFENEPI
jgi:radical SAM protein with 4Fe4S-binding SPASM domain